MSYNDYSTVFLDAIVDANALCYGGFITDEEFKAASSYAQVMSKVNLLLSMRSTSMQNIVYIGSWFGYGPYLISHQKGARRIYCVDISRAAERAARQYLANDAACVVERRDALQLDDGYYMARHADVFINTSVEHFSLEQNMHMIRQAAE